MKQLDRVEILLANLTSDADWETRSKAIEQLGTLKDGRAIKPLLAVLNEPQRSSDLNRDPNEYVRSIAAAALGNVGNKEVVPQLIQALSDRYWEVREAAAGSLGVLKDNRAIEPLIKTLADKSDKVQYAAAVALQQFPANVVAQKLAGNRHIGSWGEWILNN